MERRSVDAAGGRVDAVVAGSGRVTVVFISGLALPLEAWDAVAPPIAERARMVRYDRRRAAPSGDVPARTAADMAVELRQLLTALAVGPPYVLVGHSWGGVIARVFAHAHPADVAGLVLVDATHEVVDSRAFALLPAMYWLMGVASRVKSGRRWLLRQLCPPGSPATLRTLTEQRLADPAQWRISIRTARSEGAGIRPSLAAVRRDCPDLPAIPIHVLTAGGVSGPNVKSVRRVHEAWKAAVARAANAKYTNVPASGHYMSIDAAEVVINSICGVLDAVERR